MKKFKRILCVVLSLVVVLELLAGCASTPKAGQNEDEEIYLTKGEFFALFVYENNLTGNYSPDEIQKCEDGSVEADIIAEIGFLTEDQAHKDLKKPVTREIVVTACANATFELKTGDTADIKDADMLEDPQVIANAYASGFFELDNGYFDGAQKMTYADCEAVINSAKDYMANFHYEANTEVTENAEGVIEQDPADYEEGDIVLEFFGEESEAGSESNEEITGVSASSQKEENQPVFLNAVTTTPAVVDVNTAENAPEATFVSLYDHLGYKSVTGFTATISIETFEGALHNPDVGDTVVFNNFDALFGMTLVYNKEEGKVIGRLTKKQRMGSFYSCVFEYPAFEEAAQDVNVKNANGSHFLKEDFEILKTEVGGWALTFNTDNGAVSINAEKTFTVRETATTGVQRGAKKSVTASANMKIGNFNLDVNNLKSFAKKSGDGFIKITCDTDMSFSLSSSLRCTPYNNGNGKFPANLRNSRWTDSDAMGAKRTKIARFTPSLSGVVGINVDIYLLVTFDGKVSFSTSVSEGGVMLFVNNGFLRVQQLGRKNSEAEVNANLTGRVGIDATLVVFNFIKVMRYDVGFNANVHAIANLYHEEDLTDRGFYADEESLDECINENDGFHYCIGITLDLSVSGHLEECGVKMVLDWAGKATALNFELPVLSTGLHFEDGSFIDKCTRGNGDGEELEESKDDEVELGTYKVSIEEGETYIVDLKAVPSETMNLINSKKAISVSSGNKDICIVTYDKANKTIIVEGAGEGSTEITIKARRGILFWKKPCEQKISVTVSARPADTTTVAAYYVIVCPEENRYVYRV